MKKLLDAGNVTSVFHHDDMSDVSAIQTIQDVEPILDNNKRLQTENDGFNKDRDMKRIASIPLVIAQRWMQEDGINWMSLPKKEKGAYLRRKLNDPDYMYLRTSGGRY